MALDRQQAIDLLRQPNAISARFPPSKIKVFIKGMGEHISINYPAEGMNALLKDPRLLLV